MKTDSRKYDAMRKSASPDSPLGRDCLRAFAVGGSICLLGEFFHSMYLAAGIGQEHAALLTSVTLIALSAFATAAGAYQKLAAFAGAGTLVPVTGFANAVVSPAIEFRSEGLVTGVGAKMFIIAGPVLVYGVLAGAAYGVILFICNLFTGG